jgi:hypothetical protein
MFIQMKKMSNPACRRMAVPIKKITPTLMQMPERINNAW